MASQASSQNANKLTFLMNLAAGKSVKVSAEAAGIPRRTVYTWRDADPDFAEAWEDAITGSVEVLEDEVRDRAMDRSDKNSHILLMFLLKKHKPEYRENYKSEVHLVKDTVKEFDFTPDEIAEGIAILQKHANKPS